MVSARLPAASSDLFVNVQSSVADRKKHRPDVLAMWSTCFGERIAGRGSYGSVYKVRDRVTGQIVAAKVLTSAGPNSPVTRGCSAPQTLGETS